MNHDAIRNIPYLAGNIAGRKEFFGPFNRYALFPVHTRFNSVSWIVEDAEDQDQETGLPKVIVQEKHRKDALLKLKDILDRRNFRRLREEL